MKDSYFKNLLHCADNYVISTRGQEIDKGYKPDIMLKDGNNYIIMECDTNTTRKGIIGGVIKAAKFLTGERKGVSVLVLQERKNITVKQIHSHLKPYFDWIQPITNLQAIYIISAENYVTLDKPLKLLDNSFMQFSKSLLRIDSVEECRLL